MSRALRATRQWWDIALMAASLIALAFAVGQCSGQHGQRAFDADGLMHGALWHCAIEHHRFETVDEAYRACFPPFWVPFHVQADSFRLDTANASPNWRERNALFRKWAAEASDSVQYANRVRDLQSYKFDCMYRVAQAQPKMAVYDAWKLCISYDLVIP